MYSHRLILILLSACIVATPTLAVAAPSTTRADDIALINRLSWGVTDSDLRAAEAQGIEAWLHDQLHPAPGEHLPAAIAAQIDAFPDLHKSPGQLAKEVDDQFRAEEATQKRLQPTALSALPTPTTPDATQMAATNQTPAPIRLSKSALDGPSPQQVRQARFREVMRQTQSRALLRALYAPEQLREQMSWFWFNHFNVYEQKSEIRLLLADYEDHALRPHALGRFRDLLEATLRSPAMLLYLDNAQNAVGKINENYAREIMELHTMGVGSGYSQKDVQELARILTGVSVTRPGDPLVPSANLPPGSIRDGVFAFYPKRHDFGDKLFLGHVIKGSGYREVMQAIDILADHPATAKHIATQLAQYFVADQPPPALIERLASRFGETRGDIAAVLDTLFHSTEFRASLAHPLLKDPQHFVLSAVRMAYDTRPIVSTTPIVNWLNQMGEPLYGRLTPDGYALDASAWNGPGQLAQRFDIAKAIGSGAAGLFKGDAPAAIAQPAFPNLQGALYYNGLAETLTPPTRTALAQATSPQEWNTFFLASPDFMRR